jgi:hypothetical protein
MVTLLVKKIKLSPTTAKWGGWKCEMLKMQWTASSMQ